MEKYGPLIIGAFVSLIVAIGSGYGVNRLSEKELVLTYNVSSMQLFTGEKEAIGIVTVRFDNGGQKELEDVRGQISFTDAEVKELKLQGLPTDAAKVGSSLNSADVFVPFLNPGESFSIQLLVSPKATVIQDPTVISRAKGITGQVETPDKKKNEFSELLAIVTSAGTALLMGIFSVKTISRRRSGILGELIGEKHSGDQRDIFAYALGINGFVPEAEQVRRWSRDWSYWSISDFLTERWTSNAIGASDSLRAIKAFEHILSYARVSTDSKRIIHLNAAKLATLANAKDAAAHHLKEALSEKDPVISKRMEMDPIFLSVVV